MDDATSPQVTRARLREAQTRVRAMARRIGVQLVVWGHVKSNMTALGVDELDVLQALCGCTVNECEVLGRVERHGAIGRDTDDRLLKVWFVLCDELYAIEVIGVSLQGA